MAALLMASITILVLKRNFIISIIPLFCCVIIGWLIYFGIVPNPPMFYPNQIGDIIVVTRGNIHFGFLIATSIFPIFIVWYYYGRGCF